MLVGLSWPQTAVLAPAIRRQFLSLLSELEQRIVIRTFFPDAALKFASTYCDSFFTV